MALTSPGLSPTAPFRRSEPELRASFTVLVAALLVDWLVGGSNGKATSAEHMLSA